ncbi:MAG: MBL fold metallo-hydrolase [bacterium]
MITQVDALDDLHLIDTKFHGGKNHVGAYLLDSEKPVLLDAGASTGVDTLLEGIVTSGMVPDDLEYIFLSHMHLDHAGGAGYLLESCSNASVVCHRDSVSYLSEPEKIDRLVRSSYRAVGDLAEAYGDLEAIPERRFQSVTGGDVIDLGDRTMRVIESGGHSPYHLAFYEPQAKFLYVGDAAGMWIDNTVLPATPPPSFDFEKAIKTIDDLRDLEVKHLVYPHFGVRSDGDEGLTDYRSVLTEWVSSVEEAYDRLQDEQDVVELMVEQTQKHFEIWDESIARQTIETDTTGVIGYLNDRE